MKIFLLEILKRKITIIVIILTIWINIFCSNYENNQFKVNDKVMVKVDKNSWQLYDKPFDETMEILKKNFTKCFYNIIELIGAPPEINDLTIYYYDKKSSAEIKVEWEVKMVKNELYERAPFLKSIFPDYQDSILVEYKIANTPNKMFLSNPQDTIALTHEMVHFLHGKHLLISETWEEGFARSITEMLFPEVKSYFIIEETLLEHFPELLKFPYSYQWGFNPDKLDNFKLRFVVWKNIWKDYFENNPGFLKRFHMNLYSSQDTVLTEDSLIDIGEKSQRGFRKWYISQNAFKKAYEFETHSKPQNTKLFWRVFIKDNYLHLYYFFRGIKPIYCWSESFEINTYVLTEMVVNDTVKVLINNDNSLKTIPVYSTNFVVIAVYPITVNDVVTIKFPDNDFSPAFELGPIKGSDITGIKKGLKTF